MQGTRQKIITRFLCKDANSQGWRAAPICSSISLATESHREAGFQLISAALCSGERKLPELSFPSAQKGKACLLDYCDDSDPVCGGGEFKCVTHELKYLSVLKKGGYTHLSAQASVPEEKSSP